MAVFSLDKNYFFPVKIIKIVSHSVAWGILLLYIHKSWFHANALIKVEKLKWTWNKELQMKVNHKLLKFKSQTPPRHSPNNLEQDNLCAS